MVIAGDLLLAVMALYAAAGALFSIRFVTVIASGVNDRSLLAGPFFRAALVPGAMLLWPWLMLVERGRTASRNGGPLEAGE